jgi:glycosyltransferase involved in cell wall biosynthesis
MRIVYAVLSPTFGMYQVAADLANRLCIEHEVHLLAAEAAPLDRFAPAVHVHRLTRAGNSGMEMASLNGVRLARLLRTAAALQPDLVHVVAPHVWNLPLVLWLRRLRIPVVYTLHDLDPHYGTAFSGLMRLFNSRIVYLVDRLFVYGQVYRQRLEAAGLSSDRIAVIPLLHLFLGYQQEQALWQALNQPGWVTHEPFVLFFGRLEPYKGLDVLLDAFRLWSPDNVKLLVAGRGDISAFSRGHPLPSNVQVLNGHVRDDQAIQLFRTCGLLALPYIDATQSALIAAAYAFRKPVLVTRAGALPEYVEAGKTGFVVAPGDALALAQTLAAAFERPERLAAMGEAGWQWYQTQRICELRTILDVYRSVERR